MPVSLTTIIEPAGLFRMMPPVAGVGAESLSTSVLCPLVCSTMFWPGGIGGGTSASAGTSATIPQNPPTQIGWQGSPCSNSIQTADNIGGTMYAPAWMPAIGTQGSAQFDGITPRTSGTSAVIRPRCSGSMLLMTVPRYLP